MRFFGILEDSLEFFEMLQDLLLTVGRILEDSLRFLGFFGILWDSLRFFEIF